MKKTCKKISIVLAAVMLIAGVAGVNPAAADAKKAGLNKKKLLMYVGDTYKLKVNGTKKKVKWSSNKKQVASVTKKGVVKAKSAGAAKITAKAGSKKYNCKVTVKVVASTINTNPAPSTTTPPAGNVSTVSNSVLAANLSVSVEPIQGTSSAVFAVTNNNSQAVSYYKVNYQFKDAAGVVVNTGSITGYAIAPGQTQYRTEYIGEKYIPLIDVSKSVMSVTVNASLIYVDASSSVTVTDTKTVEGDISLTYYNADTSDVSVHTNVLFYDEQGKLIDARWEYCILTPGKTEFETVRAPYEYDDTTYEKVSTYSTYKIYNYAYKY